MTEQITGIDLVGLQIDIAEGKELPVKQNQIAVKGHAMEMRIYAEDPKRFTLHQGKLASIGCLRGTILGLMTV